MTPTLSATRTVTGPRPTTVIRSPRLSDAVGCDLTIVSEAFQYTGSFKFRAAWNVAQNILHPSVVTASSGNFGQAMAYACQLTEKRCTVVMPDNSAAVKIDAVRAYGATVDLIETTKITREDRVAELAALDPEAYVASPYDDPLVIAGNASLGRELTTLDRDDGPFDCIVVPVGGGGLASGVIVGLREASCMTPVIAAEPLLGNDFAESLRMGHIVENAQEPQTIADGARTRSVGVHNWRVLQTGVAGAIEVPEEHIEAGVGMYFRLANLKVEPTGALTLGALLARPERFAGQRVCIVVSGGNVDPEVYTKLL
jgi:threonine dehydratase